MKIFLIIIIVILLLWTIATYIAVRSIEEPAYTVVEKKTGYEMRQYSSYIVAQVEVTGNQESALNAGFRLLAGYIFGGNTSKTSIAMTVPVSETVVSEKIAMTVPVSETVSQNGKRIITFSMPSKYTLETLPKPNSPEVKLITIPSEKRAVLRYTWWSPESRVEAKKEALLDALKRDNVTATGSVSSHFYNPPFSIPFLRRNEVSVQIK